MVLVYFISMRHCSFLQVLVERWSISTCEESRKPSLLRSESDKCELICAGAKSR